MRTFVYRIALAQNDNLAAEQIETDVESTKAAVEEAKGGVETLQKELVMLEKELVKKKVYDDRSSLQGRLPD